jgi:hypothetical protein
MVQAVSPSLRQLSATLSFADPNAQPIAVL